MKLLERLECGYRPHDRGTCQFVGTTAAILGATLAGVGGSVASGIIGSNAAGNAASAQANAANNAASLERQSATDALNFNKLQYGNSLTMLAPWLNTGQAANSRLSYLMGLSPNSGLPPGVINPNAPQSNTNGGTNLASLLGGRGTGPNGTPGDAVLPMDIGGRAGIMNASAFGGTINNTNTGQSLLSGAPGSNFGPAQFAGDPTGQFNPGGTGGLGINPATGQTFPGNPDANNFGNGGVINATTNQGGTGQVPRTDGGGDPNNPTAPPPGGGFGSLAQGWGQTFQSPTNVTEQNDPGFQFRLEQGQKALQASAAARGGLLTGGTAKAINDYAQNSASNEYGNVYNRALQNYQTNYNTFSNDQSNLFNRLSALSGTGQTTANQLSNSGLTSANNASNILLGSAGQIGQQYNNAAAANASGYVGGANALGGAIGGSANSLSGALSLYQLLNAQRNSGGTGV